MKLIIPGTLPSTNEIIDAAKDHWSKYSGMKQKYTTLVALHAKKLPVIEQQADITITWICKDRRQDKDNIMGGQKFIFDGLIKSGRLKNDGWKEIRDVNHRFEVDKANPRVEIEILEVSA